MSKRPADVTHLGADEAPPEGRAWVLIRHDSEGRPISATVQFGGRSTETQLKHMTAAEAEAWAIAWAEPVNGKVYIRREGAS